MLWYASVAILFVSLGLAWDSSYPIFCNEEQDGPCLQRVADSCYPCLHAMETSCPGTDTDFDNCFCPIPSASWTTFEKCINDTSNGCADGGLGENLIFVAFGTECANYNQFICEKGANLDPVEQKLSSAVCTNPIPTDSIPASTSLPASTTISEPVSTIVSKPTSISQAQTSPTAHTVTAAPTTATPTSTSKAQTSATASNVTTAITTPTPTFATGGAAGVQLAGSTVLALLVAGAVMNAL